MFLPFIDFFARLVIWILPDKEVKTGLVPTVWHLDDSMLNTPVLAIDLARSEMARMAKIVKRMHFAVIHPFLSNDERFDEIFPELSLLEGVELRKDKIDFLESKTREYLLQISRKELGEDQAVEVASALAILNNLRRTSDVITRTIVPLIERKEALGGDFSAEGKKELVEYHSKAGKQLERLERVLKEGTKKLAKKIRKRKSRYSDLDIYYRQQHIRRLLEERPESIETHRIHMAMMDAIKQINTYTASIAEQVLSKEQFNIGRDDDENGLSDEVAEVEITAMEKTAN